MQLRHSWRPSRCEKGSLHALESPTQALVVEDVADDDCHVQCHGTELVRIAHERANGHTSAGELVQYRSTYIPGRTSHQQHCVSYTAQVNTGPKSCRRKLRSFHALGYLYVCRTWPGAPLLGRHTIRASKGRVNRLIGKQSHALRSRMPCLESVRQELGILPDARMSSFGHLRGLR